MRLIDFIPPVLFNLHKKLSSDVLIHEYDCYENALEASDTYEDPEVVEVVSQKTIALKKILESRTGYSKIYNPQIIQNLFIIEYVNSRINQDEPLNILELGGACGANFFELKHLIPGKINNWHIVETPAMAAAGKKTLQNDQIKFFDKLNDAVSNLGKRNLIIAQGVLQHLPVPLETLRNFFSMDFEYIYITRTEIGLNIAKPIIVNQITNLLSNGPTIMLCGVNDKKRSYPKTILPKSLLEEEMEKGHKIVFLFDESKKSIIKTRKTRIETKLAGYLLKSGIE